MVHGTAQMPLDKKKKWMPGSIIKRIGEMMYLCSVNGEESLVRRHHSQIKRRMIYLKAQMPYTASWNLNVPKSTTDVASTSTFFKYNNY